MATRTLSDIRIYGIRKETLSHIKSIAGYYGKDANTWLRTVLKEIVRQYPAHIKEVEPLNENKEEIRISNVQQDTVNELHNVAGYYNMDTSSFLRHKLKEIVDAFPDHMKDGTGE